MHQEFANVRQRRNHETKITAVDFIELNVRIIDLYRPALANQMLDDGDYRAFAQIVGPFLEGQTEDAYRFPGSSSTS